MMLEVETTSWLMTLCQVARVDFWELWGAAVLIRYLGVQILDCQLEEIGFFAHADGWKWVCEPRKMVPRSFGDRYDPCRTKCYKLIQSKRPKCIKFKNSVSHLITLNLVHSYCAAPRIFTIVGPGWTFTSRR
jgi:hypothetical protein